MEQKRAVAIWMMRTSQANQRWACHWMRKAASMTRSAVAKAAPVAQRGGRRMRPKPTAIAQRITRVICVAGGKPGEPVVAEEVEGGGVA